MNVPTLPVGTGIDAWPGAKKKPGGGFVAAIVSRSEAVH